MAQTISVVINGTSRQVAERSSLAAVLDGLGISRATAVVECNGVIVPRDRFEHTVLGPGDKLELVRFMGGG